MSNLYHELATVYEAMYHTFIDYQEEYLFYSTLLQKYNQKEVLEIGCGTGNLATSFLEENFHYVGLDLSEEMIKMAKRKVPNCEFVVGDMRTFKLSEPIQSIIMTARTISYLLSNKAMNTAFQNIVKNMQQGGVFAFDFIDANEFMPVVAKEEIIRHQAIYQGVTYVRDSIWRLNLEYGMDFSWESIFYKKEKDDLLKIAEDHAIIRAFTLNEIEIFLTLNGFVVREVITRPSYAFPTYVIVAEKILE